MVSFQFPQDQVATELVIISKLPKKNQKKNKTKKNLAAKLTCFTVLPNM